MSVEKSKGGKPQSGAAKSLAKSATLTATAPPGGPQAPIRVVPKARLFRRIDWITFAATALLVFIGYYLTLAPDLTLEDSGELAVGSFYAGVPHPPGYPVWTLFTWLFTVLIPFKNIAWRVALASAVSGATACGLVGLVTSRGSSLLLEGIAEFKNIDKRWESALCMLSGSLAALLFGFNGFMWSQSVIVEVYPFSVLSFMLVLCCLLNWIYAPERRRYLYWAAFWFGICFTNHQTLIVAAMGIEVAVLAAAPKLGRDVMIVNSIIYILGLVLKAMGVVTVFDQNVPLFVIYNLVGLGSLVTAAVMMARLGKPLSEWKPVLICVGLWILGFCFYFYLPIASMTNPPMNWAYPRTKEGFIHALSRGQYDKINPTNDPFKFLEQVWMYFQGAATELHLVYLLIALIPFFYYRRMQKRERAWMVGLTGMYLGLAFLLLILLNPSVDRQASEQTRVFFAASHIILVIFIGYGVTLIGGMASLNYQRYRNWLLWGGLAAAGLELVITLRTYETTEMSLLRASDVIGLTLAVGFVLAIALFRTRAPLGVLIALFAIMPTRSILSNWADNEERGHLFGYWFGHDMFTPPFGVYPEMARNAILFGGTDPGRFCPTYMIFCESFIPPSCKPRDPKFDRRDVYIITQNALADHTYLNYIRAHYNRSTEHDPYFFSELFRSDTDVQEGRTNLMARMLVPLDRFLTNMGERIEKRRRAEGVFPPKEIHTPTPDESQIAFQDYVADAQRRLQLNQLKPGEDVRIVDNRVQVAGQTAVMAINGLLTKVIFDANPNNEFYVEESFPLDWMYPNLSPFGIIMKINRQPVPMFTPEVLQKDHEFWSKYSQRLVGNWITYDTPIKDICAFAQRVYLRRDFTGFTGDRKFVRDDVAQKSFSKLRSAIGGLYVWRLGADCPQDLHPKNIVEQQRLLREAEFALKQSYAFCPYSPEAVYKLVLNLLVPSGRLDEAIEVTETSLKFDENNGVFQGLLAQLKNMRASAPSQTSVEPPPQQSTTAEHSAFAQLEQRFHSNPADMQVALDLAAAYKQAHQTDAADHVLQAVVNNPRADVPALVAVAQAYADMGNRPRMTGVIQRLKGLEEPLLKQYQANTNNIPAAFQLISVYVIAQQTNQANNLLDELVTRPKADPSTLLSAAQAYAELLETKKLETTLERLTQAVPESPEAWYDLATVQATLGKSAQALETLRKCMALNQQRLKVQSGAKDLRATAANEIRFAQLRQLPEFQRLVKTN